MDSPGPWFTSTVNSNTVLNFYHHSMKGRYASQPPLLTHGMYPVLTCTHPLTAFQVSKFPEFIRILELIVKSEEVLEAIRAVDYQIAEIAVQTMNNLGTEDHTPRSYKMLDHPKVVPVNPTIGLQFTKELEHYRLDFMLAKYREFWVNHPWKENRGRWI